jgi:hypothetical protein
LISVIVAIGILFEIVLPHHGQMQRPTELVRPVLKSWDSITFGAIDAAVFARRYFEGGLGGEVRLSDLDADD